MKNLTTCFLALLSFSLFAQDYIPVGAKCDSVLQNTYYQICYSKNHKQANWVAHWLTVDSVNGSASRTNNFRADTRVSDPVQKTDYSKTGFDRGHLVPAGDMKLNKQAMSETFFMTNMSPQRPRFNQGVWAQLENGVRDMVRKMGNAYVITAPILAAKLPRIRSGVSIPERYYKIAYFPDAGIMRAYLIENDDQNGVLYSHFQVSVDQVEAETGLDFFSQLPDSIEDTLESELR